MLHAGAHDGRLGIDQRNGLALHVGAHQGAVGVVVLQERDQRRRDGDDLLGRDVHEIDFHGIDQEGLAAGLAGVDLLGDQPAFVVQLGVGLGDGEFLLLPGGQVEGMVAEQRQLFAGLLQAG